MNEVPSPQPGWYPSPLSRQHGLERWWDGQSWTAETRVTPSGAEPRSTKSTSSNSLPNVAGTARTSQLGKISFALALCTLFLLFFNFGIFAIGALEALFALATVGVGIALIIARIRGWQVRLVVTLVELCIGLVGVWWFVQTATVAFQIAHARG